MAFDETATFSHASPSEEQQEALRMILMYYEDKSKQMIDEIKSRVDDIIARDGIVSYIPTESSEKHKAIFYGRKTVTKKVLEKNYGIFRRALGEWIIARNEAVPSLLKPAMQAIGLAPEESFIDRRFVETSFHQRVGGEPQARAAARRILLEHEGFWLLYRLSTLRGTERPRPTDPTSNIRDRLINLSLLRICNAAYLGDADHLSPRFKFEFRGDDRTVTRRAEGYLVPLGDHLFLIGRRASRIMPTITVLSWPIGDFDFRGPITHADNIGGLAYAANADGRQVAFYFVAKFIRESANLGFSSAYPAVCQIFQRLIGAYPYGKLNAAVTAAYEEARNACSAAGIDWPAVQSPPILAESELTGLISRSENDVVFREG
jgi:hypothetical protein